MSENVAFIVETKKEKPVFYLLQRLLHMHRHNKTMWIIIFGWLLGHRNQFLYFKEEMEEETHPPWSVR